ncbi:MAG: ComEC/Rec2 family competence protein [Candidatus Vogelbacteria bacterium]
MYNFLAPLLRPLVLGFFAGVLLASLAGDILESIWLLFLFLALVFIFWSLGSPALPSGRPSRRKMFLPISAFLLALALGFLSIDWAEKSYEAKLPATDFREMITVVGIISDEPDERDRDTRLTFRPDKSAGRLLLVVPNFPIYHYGDRLRVVGKTEEPHTFETDIGLPDGKAGRVFDYPAYLHTRGIGAVMYQPRIESLNENRGSKLIGGLFAFKNVFLNQLNQTLPEPQSSLLGGLVVGGKRSLGAVWQEHFRQAGLIHLVVLSGYNLTIIGVGIAWLFTALRLRRSLALLFSALAVILFAIMVGGGASVIRAAVMAIIVIFARLTGRSYDAGRALITAMVVMVAINPLILINDIGFQLSCLATAGLIYGSPLIERWFNFIPAKFGLRSVITTTTAAQLAVLPWLLFVMGQVPIYALLTNILVVPIVPLAMFLSAIIGLAGLIILPLTYLLAPLGYLIATYILTVTSIFSALPGAGLSLKTFPFALVLLIYLGYFWLWRRMQPKLTTV